MLPDPRELLWEVIEWRPTTHYIKAFDPGTGNCELSIVIADDLNCAPGTSKQVAEHIVQLHNNSLSKE